MKLKIGFGEGGIKGFFVRHVEKMIFGVVILLVVFFVYSSAKQEGISLSETPEKLKSEAQLARGHVTENSWRALEPERVKKVGNYPARAEEIRTPIRDDQYAPDRPLLQRDPIPPHQKRRDPELFPPTKVEASGGVFSVAWRLTKPDDPYASDKDAVAAPVEAPKPKKPKRDRRRPMYGDESYDMYSSEEMMGSTGSDSYMGEGSGMYGSTGTAGARRVGNFYLEHYVKGFPGRMAGGGAARGMVVPRSFGVVSVTALVPYERQWDEYERALAEAQGYSPEADVPRYLYYMAERAEVTDDLDAPLNWKPVSNTKFALQQAMQFGGFPKEVADPNYVIPNILTMPIPPILLKDYEGMALHSEVPKLELRPPTLAAGTPGAPQELAPDATPSDTGDLSAGLPQLPKMAPGMGTPGYEGYGPTGMPPGMGSGGYGEEGYNMYESEGGMGYGRGGYGGMPGQVRRPVAKHLMVRFFDLTAEVGKSYRYRVSVLLEDPNRPQNPQAEPSRRILEQTVVARLTKIEADDQEYQKRTNTPRRTFYVQTAWSEPSGVVKVQGNDGFFAGAVTPGRFIKLATRPGEQGPEVQITESAGKMVVVAWDRRRAVEVPAERDVRRGAYLNFTQDADVMHPLTTQLKTVAQFSFASNGLVLDLRGGDPLIVDVIGDARTGERKILGTPGEFMVVDAKGNLVVCNEIDDTEEYRRLMFIEEPGLAPVSGGMGYESGSEMDYGYEGGGFFGP
jgi:hypothetical protein